jgi:hypothetical protein
LQDVVDDITCTRASFSKIIFGKKAEGFPIHLKFFQVNLLQVKLTFTVMEELDNILPGPTPWISGKTSWKATFDMCF